MATTTTRLGLDKPAYADAADIAVLNQNFDDIDAAVGMRVVTSTTRPATPWNGQIIFETDTSYTLVWDSTGAAWKQIGGAAVVCTSSTRPASPLNGQLIYETDTRKLLVYNTSGAVWRTPILDSVVADFTALAALTGMVSGSRAFVEEGDITMVFDGTAWIQQNEAIFASAAARDTAYAKASAAYRVQGVRVFRSDLAEYEQYYALYNASTNVGGRDTAGFYTTTRADGLVPIRPTSVAVAGGTATTNALGQVSFTTATSVSLNGVFTSAYNSYKMTIRISAQSAAAQLSFRFRNAGADNSTNNYYQTQLLNRSTGATQTNNGSNTYSNFFGWNSTAGASYLYWTGDIINPAIAAKKHLYGKASGDDSTSYHVLDAAIMFNLTANTFDGITIFPTAGNVTGTIQILAYNN